MSKLNLMKSMIDSMIEDETKFFEKGNAVAGTRLRNGMQEIKKLCNEVRIDVQSAKKSK